MFVALLFVVNSGFGALSAPFLVRNLCPAGALMGLFSRSPLLRRNVNDSCSRCGQCIRKCPTAAISENPAKTVYSECIVCLECVKICPEAAVSFSMGSNERPYRYPLISQDAVSVLAVGSGLLWAGLHTRASNDLRRGGKKGD